MSARDAILGRIRRAAGVTGTEAPRRAAVADRLQRAPRGVVPAHPVLEPEARIALFLAKAVGVQASAVRIPDPSDVPAAVADHLRRHNLPQAIRMGEDPRLAALDWTREPQLTVSLGPSAGADLVCVSHAEAAIAETGTLALVSGPDNPTTLNLLPDHHVVVVDAETVLPNLESVLDRIRQRYGTGRMPRTLNLISGPSRSGDIEQTLLLGAHGPRSLVVLVVG